MDVEFGNAGQLDTKGTGWFVGFSDWARAGNAGVTDLRYIDKHSLSHTLSIKWMSHPSKDKNGGDKPISVGRTISILASEAGKFRIKFSLDPTYPPATTQEYFLENHGDFVAWGEGVYHSWGVDEPCVIATVRWIPLIAIPHA